MSEHSQDFAHSTVPHSSRKGFLPILVVMVGFTFFSASMWSGGALGQGLNFNDFMVTVMIGNLLLGLYTSSLAYIGSKTGLSTHLLTQYAFGKQGPSWLLLFSPSPRLAGLVSVLPCLPCRSTRQPVLM